MSKHGAWFPSEVHTNTGRLCSAGSGRYPVPRRHRSMQPSDSLPPSATALVPLACGLPRCGRLFCAFGADDTCARYVSCVGDWSPALRHTGVYRGEARASQVTGPSSSTCHGRTPRRIWSTSSPTTRRSHCCLQVNQDPGHPGRLEVSGPHAPWPTRSPAYASPRPFLTPSHILATGSGGLTLGRAGFAPTGRHTKVSEVWSSSLPFDRHCLVALKHIRHYTRSLMLGVSRML